jgi:ABC-2 type transport system ATP-binding protein
MPGSWENQWEDWMTQHQGLPSEKKEGDGFMTPRDMDDSQKAVVARDLVFRYPGEKKAALDKVSFSVRKNEFFGIVGPNGAGKTTLMAALATLIRPRAGHLDILGNDAGRNPGKIRADIGLVPQESTLYQSLTVRENLQYFGGLYGLSGRALKTCISRCLEMVNLTAHQDRMVRQCSGGMKRRASIALGIVGQPKVLLLDEPAVNIDIHSRKLIFDRLTALKKENMTIICTTHILKDIEDLCDWVAVMDQGRIVACGNPRKLSGGKADSFEAWVLQLTRKSGLPDDRSRGNSDSSENGFPVDSRQIRNRVRGQD